MSLHLGSIIRDYCKKRLITVGEMCQKMGVNPISVYHVLNASDLKGFGILRVSKALNHDFFQYYQAYLEDNPYKKIEELTAKLLELNKTIDELTKENVTLKTENDLMKKVLKAN